MRKEKNSVPAGFIRVYMAYIDDRYDPIAVSDNADLVKIYMESHRGLKNSEYCLETHNMTEEELFIKYDEFYLYEYNGYFIPNIDITMIECNIKPMSDILEDLILNLKNLITISTDIKDIGKDNMSYMIKTYKALIKMKYDPKILDKLENADLTSNSILYCSMDEYLHYLKDFKEWKMICSQHLYCSGEDFAAY